MVLFLKMFFGGYFLRYGGYSARITGPVTFIAFLPRERLSCLDVIVTFITVSCVVFVN